MTSMRAIDRLLLHGMEVFSFQIMRFALLCGANPNIDVNFIDREGYHLVTRCTRSGEHRLLKLLLKYGGNPDAISAAWPSIKPIHMAIVKEHVECIQVLASGGATLSAPCTLTGSSTALTPIELAVRLQKFRAHDALLKIVGTP